jgi:hypothetical protein
MAQSHPTPEIPAWIAALAGAPVDEESLSPEEISALEMNRAKLRERRVELVTQNDIERAASELEAH